MSGNGQQRLVLWDVDLTLIDARGFGKHWYGKALRKVTGDGLREMPDTAGRTELAIASEVLELHGVAANGVNLEAIFTALTTVVAEDRAALSARGSALPGAAEALTALAAMPGVVQTLVTGNLPPVAFIKLDVFDLHHHVDFDIGGFGTDSVHRHDLVAASVAKASAKHGTTFAPEEVVVVGDTPHDVTGALHFGAVAVGVTTGRSDADELDAAGAHVVLPDLSDTDVVLEALRFQPTEARPN